MNDLMQPLPPNFKSHSYEFTIEIDAESTYVWMWLNNPDTFTKTQIWPFRVEFYSPNPSSIPNGFNEGVLTNHRGPFINFAGKLTRIEPDYRDLQYFYGSYAITFRWIRPYRLEFWTEEKENKTILKCKISSYVKPGFIYQCWDGAQKIFWSRFKYWARKSVKKIKKEAQQSA